MKRKWRLRTAALNAVAVAMIWALVFWLPDQMGAWGLLIIIPAFIILAATLLDDIGRRR